MKKITFLTVFYENDAFLLQLQAKSLLRFFCIDQIASIILIWNGSRKLPNELHLPKEVDQSGQISRAQILSYYDYLALKVLIVDPLDLGNSCQIEHKRLASIAKLPKGYLRQQAYKLAGCLLANSQFIVILDTKNHFIRPICFDTFFDSKGRPKIFFAKRYDNSAINRLNASLRLLRVNTPPVEGNVPLPPTITPHPIRRDHVTSLIYYLESRGDALHVIFADENIKATEFFMLVAYCLRLDETVSTFYTNSPKNYATIFRVFPSTCEQMESLISFAESEQCVCLAIHPYRNKMIEQPIWSRIENIWQASDLMIQGINEKYVNSIVERS